MASISIPAQRLKCRIQFVSQLNKDAALIQTVVFSLIYPENPINKAWREIQELLIASIYPGYQPHCLDQMEPSQAWAFQLKICPGLELPEIGSPTEDLLDAIIPISSIKENYRLLNLKFLDQVNRS